MGKLPTDEIRSTLHVERELNDEFLKACEKKFGKKFKKKSAYTELMRKFVEETKVNGKDESDTPPKSDEVNDTTETKPQDRELTYQEREELARKLAEKRKELEKLVALPPPKLPKLSSSSNDDISSFLAHVPRDRKIKITRIEID